MRRVVLDKSCTDAQGRIVGAKVIAHDLLDESHEASSACWCRPALRTQGNIAVYEHAQKD
jgi:hypothetical protein